MDRLIEHVYSVTYHRNGITGEGFYAVRFLKAKEDRGTAACEMVGVVFTQPKHVAVFPITDPTSTWRGDHFEQELREIITQYQQTKREEFEAYLAKR